MTLRINTNIAALTAHKNLTKNDNSLSNSLERLSSGLRINRAADDASGMAIADSLRSQALGLGQAMANANDGISMVQTADGALDESINIVNTIKTKSIQAAQDGQTTDSRKAIQADINKLMEELDAIARTTSFNGQKLLSGQFTNKQFQIGAYSGETVAVSIGSSESNKTGHLTTAMLGTTSPSGGEVRLGIFSNVQNAEVAIQGVVLAYDNDANHSMGALADAINKVSDSTGVTAQAKVEITSTNSVAAGTTGEDFSINGVAIGAVEVLANDNNGALVNAINQKSSQHGITASTDQSGHLTLTAGDGRAIQTSGSTDGVLLGSNLSTFGTIKLFQVGANEIKINDQAQTVSVNLTNNLVTNGSTTTTVDSVLTKDSVVGNASVLESGSQVGFTLTDTNLGANITTEKDSVLTAGSGLGSGSVIKSGSLLGGTVALGGNHTTTADSQLTTGSYLGSGSVLSAGTVVTTQFVSGSNTYTVGQTLASDVTLSGALTLTDQMLVKANSTLDDASTIRSGSYIGVDVTSSGASTMTVGMTLKSGSVIADATGLNIQAGSTIGGDTTLGAAATVTATMNVKAGSILATASELAKGSTIGGDTTTAAAETLAGDMSLAAGSQLASGSVLKAGSVLTTDIWVAGGNILAAGTVLTGDAVTSGTNYLNNSLTLKSESTLALGSVLAATQTAASGASATTSLSDVQKYTLADIDVTSQDSAQVSISIADSALKNLDKIRSDLGSVQNQLTSTIANVSVTKVNISAAESNIRDVDFASESSNYSKMQVLMQASTFALAQANASSQNVLSLLQ